MLRALRQSSRLATLLVLALTVGPAAAALCPHPGGEADHGAMHESPAMEHAMTGHAMPEAPPCHEEAPQPEPEDASCDSPCCIVAPEAPAPTPQVSPAVASALAPPVAAEAPEPAPEAARLGATVEPPGPPLVRVHLLLGRFLT